MKITTENIEYIAQQALIRRKLVTARSGDKPEYTQEELVARSEDEVELYDSIDCLISVELDELVGVARAGGFELEKSKTASEIVDCLYLDINIDKYIKAGLEKQGLIS